MIVYTSRKAAWLQRIAPEKFNDTELFRIVTFFVFHSPYQGLSAMGCSLLDYGWTAPWKKPYWLNRQLRQAASNYELLYAVDRYDKMDVALEKAHLKDDFPSDFSTERICFYNGRNVSQFLNVFYHLRNSFAHGRLNMMDINGECIFVFEDVVPRGNDDKLKVSARMILRKSTLLKWINIIESGEKEYCKT